MIDRKLHMDKIRIPNVESVRRGFVPGSEVVRERVAGAAERKVHSDRSIGRPTFCFEIVAVRRGGAQNANDEREEKSFIAHDVLTQTA